MAPRCRLLVAFFLVVPGSGTEQLAGISGALTITNRDGKHFYELQYTLPGQ